MQSATDYYKAIRSLGFLVVMGLVFVGQSGSCNGQEDAFRPLLVELLNQKFGYKDGFADVLERNRELVVGPSGFPFVLAELDMVDDWMERLQNSNGISADKTISRLFEGDGQSIVAHFAHDCRFGSNAIAILKDRVAHDGMISPLTLLAFLNSYKAVPDNTLLVLGVLDGCSWGENDAMHDHLVAKMRASIEGMDQTHRYWARLALLSSQISLGQYKETDLAIRRLSKLEYRPLFERSRFQLSRNGQNIDVSKHSSGAKAGFDELTTDQMWRVVDSMGVEFAWERPVSWVLRSQMPNLLFEETTGGKVESTNEVVRLLMAASAQVETRTLDRLAMLSKLKAFYEISATDDAPSNGARAVRRLRNDRRYQEYTKFFESQSVDFRSKMTNGRSVSAIYELLDVDGLDRTTKGLQKAIAECAEHD